MSAQAEQLQELMGFFKLAADAAVVEQGSRAKARLNGRARASRTAPLAGHAKAQIDEGDFARF